MSDFTLQSKLIQHFSKQLCAKAKLDTVPERLRQYPNQELWLKIVGIDPETIKVTCGFSGLTVSRCFMKTKGLNTP